jgi:uncharacterized cupredoxin-like copper-binding protein
MQLNTIHAAALCGLLIFSGIANAHDKQHGHDTQNIGMAGEAAKVTRTVNIDMSDAMRFTPDNVKVRQGETIRFIVKNAGQVKHEFVLGTESALKEHYELMKKFPEMEHSDPNMATVAPGKTAEVIWRFTKAGKIDFACLQPGHYDAGMMGSVMVAGKKIAGHEAKTVDDHTDHQH